MIADGGRKIRFPDEQKLHVTYFHPEVMDDPDKLEVTLQKPELIAKGATEDTKIYYKFFGKTPVGAKYLAVVVKLLKWRRLYSNCLLHRESQEE